MTVLRRFVSVAAILAVATSTLVLAKPQAPAQGAPASTELSQKLPVDPDVTTGTFPNGLKYYVRTNALPAKRAELRLVVNVG